MTFQRTKWTKQRIAEALARLHNATGETPGHDVPYKDLMRRLGVAGNAIDRPYPSAASIYHVFGTFRDAWTAAGVLPNGNGHSPVPGKTAGKVCGGCRRERPVERFNRRAKAKDGLQQWCKDCTLDAQRKKARGLRQSADSGVPVPRASESPTLLPELGGRETPQLLRCIERLATATDSELAEVRGWVRIGMAIGAQRGAR